jgi:hypothetical protein
MGPFSIVAIGTYATSANFPPTSLHDHYPIR